ncbi:MAG: S8 family serine peptidase, partial [Sediminibacterium sp.]|nr:S8 family serine peptidase [Sediminibacterium sp.]
GIKDNGMPMYKTTFSNVIAATTVGTTALWPGGVTGFNLNGSSSFMTNKMAVWDEGRVRTSHQEFNNRVIQQDNPNAYSDHSTHVMGTMMAMGFNPDAKGMSFGLTSGLAFEWNNDNSEMANAANTKNILLSNHSYGNIVGWNYNNSSSRWEFYGDPGDNEDAGFGFYNGSAQIYDSIAYNAPYYLIVKSAGNNRDENGPNVGEPYYRFDNTGNWVRTIRDEFISSNDSFNTIGYEGNAKNILTIGAVYGLSKGYIRAVDVKISSFSSWGPTDDGRIKPDLVADGVNLYSPTSTSDISYATYSGTSMASPNTTGSLFLLQELYGKLKPSQFMRSATLKGLAIHTANEAGLSNGPDYIFGWGLLNVQKAALTLQESLLKNNSSTSNHLILENVLKNKTKDTFTVITSGKENLTATICWTDIKSTPFTTNILNNKTSKLINDLDIKIEGNGKIYYPWKLDPDNPNNPAFTGINNLDNVEKINIYDAPPGSKYNVIISHKNNLDRGSQAYSLIISGVGGSPLCASNSTNNSGLKIDSLQINNIAFKDTSNVFYLDKRDSLVQFFSGYQFPFYLKIKPTNIANKYVKVFLDVNANGIIDFGETILSTNNFNNLGEIKENLLIPNNLNVGTKLFLRVLLQEATNADSLLFCGNYRNGETIDFSGLILRPFNDIGVSAIINPTNNVCASTEQLVIARVENFGGLNQINFPIKLYIKNLANNTTDSLIEYYRDSLISQTYIDYTFQKKINIEAGKKYIFSSSAYIPNDLEVNNNTRIDTIQIAPKPLLNVNGSITSCSNSANFLIINPVINKNYFWYNVGQYNNPVGVGNNFNLNGTINNNYELISGANFNLGLKDNKISNTGNYQKNGGNYFKIYATAPFTIQSVKFYTRHAGQIQIDLANSLTVTNINTGDYTYSRIGQKIVDVVSSSSTPQSAVGNVDPSIDLTDTGRYYQVNLNIPTAGTYWLIAICSNGANLFRNNNITGLTYPIGPANLMNMISNSANSDKFYYYFYDMNVTTNECVSEKSTITTQSPPIPKISFSDDTMYSDLSGKLTWYLDDNLLDSATAHQNENYIIPTKSGVYHVVRLDNSGCLIKSEVFKFILSPKTYNNNQQIGLKIYPTITNTNYLSLEFKILDAPDFSYQILNNNGTEVSEEISIKNARKQQIQLPYLLPGIYIFRFKANGKLYYERFIVAK